MRYRVYVKCSFEDWVDVEAEDEDEAETKALEEMTAGGLRWDELEDINVVPVNGTD